MEAARPDGWREVSVQHNEAPHPRAVFLAGCFALCRAARCTPRTTCSCLATWCHHLVGFVPPLGGLCATTRWTLCHHLVGFVPPRGGLCATTRWTLCHHLVGFVPPRGGLCATTRWALCFLAVGRVPPHGGLGASTRWALCHHVVGSLCAAGNPRPVTKLGVSRVQHQQHVRCSRCAAAAAFPFTLLHMLCSSLQPTPAPLPI